MFTIVLISRKTICDEIDIFQLKYIKLNHTGFCENDRNALWSKQAYLCCLPIIRQGNWHEQNTQNRRNWKTLIFSTLKNYQQKLSTAQSLSLATGGGWRQFAYVSLHLRRTRNVVPSENAIFRASRCPANGNAVVGTGRWASVVRLIWMAKNITESMYLDFTE